MRARYSQLFKIVSLHFPKGFHFHKAKTQILPILNSFCKFFTINLSVLFLHVVESSLNAEPSKPEYSKSPFAKSNQKGNNAS
jgi:hypothetical protein